MQIQHPTANLIARTAAAQDKIVGDGTTSAVLLIGELLRQAERYLAEGIHPRIIAEGFSLANQHTRSFLETFKVPKNLNDHEFLVNVAKTSLRTKVHQKLADKLANIVVDAVKTIKRDNQPLDLYMIEILAMQHSSDVDTKLIKGLVLDHGARHPDMPKNMKNCYILTCNVSLELEKAVDNVIYQYKTAEGRQDFISQERKFIDDRCAKIIALKRQLCDTPDKGFVVINQKGIDPPSLQLFANEGILALRRAKRRNMERCPLSCGGVAVNSLEDLSKDVLGFAEQVYQHKLGEESYTFLEGVKNPFSCTILMKGPSKHIIEQIKDAIRDGVRAVKNTIDDGHVVPGGGAFEIAAHAELMKYKETVSGRAKFGIQAFADALLVIPKTLAANSGFDVIESILKLQEAHGKGNVVGIDVQTGEPFDPDTEGVYDNYIVTRNLVENSTVMAMQLLLVDEVLRAGKAGKGGAPTEN
jgi:T-complex protein 1 subunit zeta